MIEFKNRIPWFLNKFKYLKLEFSAKPWKKIETASTTKR